MRYWLYKCNTKGRTGRASGDWEDVFSGDTSLWGEPDIIPKLGELRSGDRLLAYQTNRNELVGVARVLGFKRYRGSRHVEVEPMEKIGAKVRPLKEQHPRIAAIHALQQGPVRTLHEIGRSTAEYLLRVARVAVSRAQRKPPESKTPETRAGGDADSVTRRLRKEQGFDVDPQVRRAIESTAVLRARRHYEKAGFKVSVRGKPFDLECRRGATTLFVEVKGTQTKGAKILLTPNEIDFARKNKMELFIVHSINVANGRSGPRVQGGVIKVIAPWRPRDTRLTPVIFSYDVSVDA